MDAELSPQEALIAALTTRSVAAARRIPGWLPLYAGVTCAVGMTLIGASNLAGHGGVARVLGIAAVVAITAHLGAYVVLARRWRREGLVPRADGFVSTARRRASYGLLFVACAIGAGFFVAGSAGWGIIAWGLIIGAETWYRLTGWRRAA